MKKNWKDIPIGGIIQQAGNSKENRTGSWSKKTPTIDQEKCIKCQKCIINCPEKVISLSDSKIKVDSDYCKGCGLCADICPKAAITMK
ncbi:MAG: 4Fe-4S dicluster domain-containing protein [Candidatus Moranbacteria bacterium]|nr:4Fe-4S dicluster domain-containing protein [Candidatus Moranbacteria bacterium]